MYTIKYMEPGIIPSVVGGMGNQMFIVAAAYVVSKVKQCPLYILYNPIENNKHNKTKTDYNKSLFKYFGTHSDIPVTQAHTLVQHGYKIFHQGNGFSHWNPNSVSPGSILTSYYQYYPPLAPYENDLRSLFLQGLSEYIEKNKNTGLNFENAAFLHVRRGDYLNIPHFHFIQSIDEYYKPSVEKLIQQANPTTIYVLSDDPKWIQEQPFFNQNPIFKVMDIPNELDALAFMTQCTAGAICANSTFSWWGAFLGAYAKRAPVFVPKRWIADTVVSLFPVEWAVI